MKAIFKFNGKTIEDEEIENISILIKLGDSFKDNENNEEYVINSLKTKSDIFKLDEFEVDCPYEDLVYLKNESFTGEGEEGSYPENDKELELLKKSCEEALKVFNEVKVAVYSNYLYDDINEEDFSLEEFLENFKIM